MLLPRMLAARTDRFVQRIAVGHCPERGHIARAKAADGFRIERGFGIPEPHLHASNQFMFCLSGRYEYTATGRVLTGGSFYWNPKGNVHGPTMAHEETVFIEIYDGPHYPQKPSWYADEQDAR